MLKRNHNIAISRKMQPVQGNITPQNKLTVDFDKIGNINNPRTNIYKMPIHEKKSLKFALRGVKALRVELFAEGNLLSTVMPTYDEHWEKDTITPLNFFGGKNFHRGLIDVPAEIVVTTCDEDLPSIMVGVVTPSKTWNDIEGEIYPEHVIASSETGPQELILVYHRGGCGFAKIVDTKPVEPELVIAAKSFNIVNVRDGIGGSDLLHKNL